MAIAPHRTIFTARKSADDVLFVPCRITGPGIDILVTGHLPDGTRTGIAFSSPTAVARAMGASQTWVRFSPDGLRSMLQPRGITHLQVDPDLVAPNPQAAPAGRPLRPSTTSPHADVLDAQQLRDGVTA